MSERTRRTSAVGTMKSKHKFAELKIEFQGEHIMENAQKNNSVVKTAFKGIAAAMGIAVVVLSVLGAATPTTLITLLGIGLFAVAAAVLK
jgi:hypothetical protein